MRNTVSKLMDQRLKTPVVIIFIEVYLIDKLKYEFSFRAITRKKSNNSKTHINEFVFSIIQFHHLP